MELHDITDGAAPAADRRNPGLLLLCRVQALFCALPLTAVLETMRPLPMQPLPGTPAFLRGLAIIHGLPTPVVDAARLLEMAPGAAARLVLLQAGERRIALLVDEVLGVRTIPPSSLQTLPPLLRDATTGSVSAVGNLDTKLLVILQEARLVPAALWAQLDARRERQ
jgi:purine-binding chemotaxis protein CheW